jgi:hypothetical protein
MIARTDVTGREDSWIGRLETVVHFDALFGELDPGGFESEPRHILLFQGFAGDSRHPDGDRHRGRKADAEEGPFRRTAPRIRPACRLKSGPANGA